MLGKSAQVRWRGDGAPARLARPGGVQSGSAVHLPAQLPGCEPGESEIALPTPLSSQGVWGAGGLSNTENKEVCLSQIFLMISPHTGQEVKPRSQPTPPALPSAAPSALSQPAWSHCAGARQRARRRAFSQHGWDAVSWAPTLAHAVLPSPTRPHLPPHCLCCPRWGCPGRGELQGNDQD